MLKRLITLAVAVMLGSAVTAATARAEFPLTPEKIKGAKLVSTDEAKALLDKGAVAVDTRKKAEYAEGHLPKALHLNYEDNSEKAEKYDASKDKWETAKLPGDKNTVLVVYCNGTRCWKSYKAALKAVELGYKNVHWYRDGFPGWKEKGLPTE